MSRVARKKTPISVRRCGFCCAFLFPNIPRKFFFLFCAFFVSTASSPDISHPFPTILRISITKAFPPTPLLIFPPLSNKWCDRSRLAGWWSSCGKVWQNLDWEYLHTISPQLLASILLLNYIQTIPSFPPRANRHNLFGTRNDSQSAKSQTLKGQFCNLGAT